jgi:cobalt-zinc-cadmium efflux system outer membrane protein
MNYSRLCAARALSPSATIQITIHIALFASLAFCGLTQRTAFGAAQIQSTRPPGRESQDEVRKPPAGEDQARRAEIRGRLSDDPADYRATAGESAQAAACQPVLTLADLERMALRANPTLPEAEAAVRAAEGRRVQAGLWPNPVVGYTGTDFSKRAFGEKSVHFTFIEQSILLGGKLGKSQRIFAQEKVLAQQEAVAQRYRVLNTVRILFYEALGAQRRVETRAELLRVAREAVGASEQISSVGQAERPDTYEIEIDAQRAELDLIMAENRRDQVWRQLGAVIGYPFLTPTCLVGDLEKGLPGLNQDAALATLLGGSPELRRAQAAVRRALAAISRARAERIPDLFVRGGYGYNTEILETSELGVAGRTGPEGFVEIGVRLPIFNRNQGNIRSAYAELEIAEREARRVELALRAQMAAVFCNYQNALRTATQYERQVLPRAKRGYQLALADFKQKAAAYPQMLIAQRNLFQAQDAYIDALVEVWQSAIQIQCFLLTGGLDAPSGAQPEGGPEVSRPEGGIEAGQSPGISAGEQGSGVSEPTAAERRNQ